MLLIVLIIAAYIIAMIATNHANNVTDAREIAQRATAAAERKAATQTIPSWRWTKPMR